MNSPTPPAPLQAPPAAGIDGLAFDPRFARLPDAFFSRVRPSPLPDPYLVAFAPGVAALLGLDPRAVDHPDFVATIAGNRVPPATEPIAAVYAGHQFGVWVPQLGDGRALLLGEVVGPQGRFDLQLKGAGRTPYSRMGDGRAVLRSAIREFLCSEAMHALGIPTTRALAIVGSDQPVIRETVETAAVLARVAPSHVRFGSFEFFFRRRQVNHVRALADHVIHTHYPELADAPQPHAAFVAAVSERTARLVAQWQAVGFCHGVMNTDNMSVLGLTIDYGPFGFLDAFDRDHVCNHSDDAGRYAYDQQPGIAHWNVACLAQALVDIVPIEAAQAALDAFAPAFTEHHAACFRAKLGLLEAREEDPALVEALLDQMHASRADFTIFFRRLAHFDRSPNADNAPLRDLLVDRAAFAAWSARYRARLDAESSDDAARRARMDAVNPKFVLRNHLAEVAIRRATEARDFDEIARLRDVLARPFDEQPENAGYADFPPDWASGLAVSCSS